MASCWLVVAAALCALSATQVSAFVSPSFLPREQNITAALGGTAELVCGVENLGTKRVLWRRTHVPNPIAVGLNIFTNDSRYNVSSRPDSNDWVLAVADVRTSDTGVYECQVTGRHILRYHVNLTVNEPSPSILPRERHITVTLGETAELVCGVEHLGREHVIWTRGGDHTPITLDDLVFATDARYTSSARPESNDWVLAIADVRTSDTGLYRCTVSGRPNLKYHIALNVDSPSFLPRDYRITVAPGETAELVCGVENLGTRMVAWRRSTNNITITIGNFRFVTDARYTPSARPASNDWVLAIADVRTSDTGDYLCIVTGRPSFTYRIHLTVYAVVHTPVLRRVHRITAAPRPSFLPREQHIAVGPGENAELVCGVENLGTKMVAWRRSIDGITIAVGIHNFADDPRYNVSSRPESNDWVLAIADVRKADAGVYECTLSGRQRRIHRVHLTVAGPSFLPREQNITAAPGETAKLICGVENLGARMVAWRRSVDGKTIAVGLHSFTSDPRFTVSSRPDSNDWVLAIADVRTSDAGEFECRLPGRHRRIHRVHLTVAGPSFLPREQNITAAPGETAKLICGVKNLGTKMVAWRRSIDGITVAVGVHIFTDDARYNVSSRPESNDWVLAIADVRTSDAGEFECTLPGRHKRIYRVHLTVAETTLESV